MVVTCRSCGEKPARGFKKRLCDDCWLAAEDRAYLAMLQRSKEHYWKSRDELREAYHAKNRMLREMDPGILAAHISMQVEAAETPVKNILARKRERQAEKRGRPAASPRVEIPDKPLIERVTDRLEERIRKVPGPYSLSKKKDKEGD